MSKRRKSDPGEKKWRDIAAMLSERLAPGEKFLIFAIDKVRGKHRPICVGYVEDEDLIYAVLCASVQLAGPKQEPQIRLLMERCGLSEAEARAQLDTIQQRYAA